MPTPAYVFFNDDQGNQIDGSVQIADREGSSEVIEFDHGIRIPTDSHTGKLTGVRMHGSARLVKAYDSASPLLYRACCVGQTLSEVTFHWYQIDDTGTEVEYYRHTLEQVKVAGVKSYMPNTKDPRMEKMTHLEEVNLVYGKITWLFVDGSLEYTDSWTAGR